MLEIRQVVCKLIRQPKEATDISYVSWFGKILDSTLSGSGLEPSLVIT